MYRKEFVELTKLALPLVLAQLAQNTISFVDTLMVGKLGNEALAGIAIGSTVFHFVLIILSGVVLGVSPIVSQAIGANDPDTAARAAQTRVVDGSRIVSSGIFAVLEHLSDPDCSGSKSGHGPG